VVIGEDVIIGDDSYIGPHSVLEFSEIGKNNFFSAHAFIGLPPQDFKYNGEKTKLIMGDNNIVREGVSFHRGSPLTGLTKIGSNCMFMANSHAGHDCVIADNVIMTNSSAAAGHVRIDNNAVISGLSAIHQFTRIGAFCMISGGSMVNQDIIPYVIARGDRAKPVCLNIVGLKRNGFKSDSIKSLKKAFKVLFHEGLILEKAIEKIKKGDFSPEAKKMAEFCADSKRGVARPDTKVSHE
jgi:UDP-N-acetylglucosamine acyltransferase